MQEVVLGSRKINRGERLGLALGAAVLVLYASRFGATNLWIIATAIYAAILLLLVLRGQRFVIVNEEGIDYKPTIFGQARWYAWSNVWKVIANSTEVALYLNDDSVVSFKVRDCKWFNFRKFRTTVERYAYLHGIDVFIHVMHVAGDASDGKCLPTSSD
ncbi:MAG: hypothetical protein RML40_02000 [Bacteroidota bacterium]|nr:hypothetical protein [Candidatus Kapabacteria bacterium]MDW8219281.1 hypothetical protein [Bacteroidota bacterium]